MMRLWSTTSADAHPHSPRGVAYEGLVDRLAKTESELVQEETRVLLRDVADHLAVIADMVETCREMVSGLMDLQLVDHVEPDE
jgi:hypothetical protein